MAPVIPEAGRTDRSSRPVVSLALAVAGAAHLAAALDHRQAVPVAVLFTAVGTVQVASALLYSRTAGRSTRLLVALTTAAPLAAWAVSRTFGIAIGHSHGGEGVGPLEVTAVTAQLVVLFGLALVGAPRARGWRIGVALVALLLAASAFAAPSSPPAEHHEDAGTPTPHVHP